jgi:hypothetical protein
METWMRRLFMLAAAGTVLIGSARFASACENCKSKYTQGTYLGGITRLGNGSAYAWVSLNEKGKPSAVGVTFTETALEGLPAEPPAGTVGTEYMLELPRQADKTPFDHVVLNWNPHGHIPEGIYTVPHFDVHFYTISQTERSKITAKGDDLKKCRKPLPPQFAIPGYILAEGAEEPMMGAHWADLSSPEFRGQPFTRTFIYGSYDGKPAFIEPMVTRAFLASSPDVVDPIKQPSGYAKAAFYPTTVSIRRDPVRHEVTVAMADMKWREASSGKPTKQTAARP